MFPGSIQFAESLWSWLKALVTGVAEGFWAMHAMERPYSAVGLINVLYMANLSHTGKDDVPANLSEVSRAFAFLIRAKLDDTKSISEDV